VDPQVVVSLKSPGLAPVKVMEAMLRVEVPILNSVTVVAALVCPTTVAANVTDEGLKETAG